MTQTRNDGVETVYNYWLGLLPQFFSQLGIAMPVGEPPDAAAPMASIATDPFAKSAKLTQEALQSLTRSYAPWMTAIPFMVDPFDRPTDAANGGVNAAMLPLQQMQQAWLAFASQLVSGAPPTYVAAFDRTFGGLSDALGFGPVRKLQTVGQELLAAGVTQNEARAAYAMLVQRALATGLEGLMRHLAETAQSGHRIDSVFELLRMWAVSTERAVHEVLQSAEGLAATAALTRAGFAYRIRLQQVASICADALDVATRRDLDEAYREIHELKREVRALRAPAGASTRARKTGKPASKRNAKS